MTLQEAIDALSALVDMDLDLNVGSSPSDQQLCDLLSSSAMRVYHEVRYQYNTVGFDPVAGDQTIPLQDDTLSGSPTIDVNLFYVDEVRLNGLPIGFLKWDSFVKAYPQYRDQDNGTPVCYSVTRDLQLVFNCPFSMECVSAGGIGITGRGCPRRFDASLVASEWDDCHRLLQWAVIRGAVPYSTDAFVDSPQAFNRLTLIDRNATADKKRFLDLQSDHGSPFSDMPTTFGMVEF